MSQQLRNHFEEIITLSDREFDYIFSHFSPRRFKKHQFLIQEGTKVDSEFLFRKGFEILFDQRRWQRAYLTICIGELVVIGLSGLFCANTGNCKCSLLGRLLGFGTFFGKPEQTLQGVPSNRALLSDKGKFGLCCFATPYSLPP